VCAAIGEAASRLRKHVTLSHSIQRHMVNYVGYNFIKIHRTPRVTPAMAAGVTNRLFGCNEVWRCCWGI